MIDSALEQVLLQTDGKYKETEPLIEACNKVCKELKHEPKERSHPADLFKHLVFLSFLFFQFHIFGWLQISFG